MLIQPHYESLVCEAKLHTEFRVSYTAWCTAVRTSDSEAFAIGLNNAENERIRRNDCGWSKKRFRAPEKSFGINSVSPTQVFALQLASPSNWATWSQHFLNRNIHQFLKSKPYRLLASVTELLSFQSFPTKLFRFNVIWFLVSSWIRFLHFLHCWIQNDSFQNSIFKSSSSSRLVYSLVFSTTSMDETQTSQKKISNNNLAAWKDCSA